MSDNYPKPRFALRQWVRIVPHDVVGYITCIHLHPDSIDYVLGYKNAIGTLDTALCSEGALEPTDAPEGMWIAG